MSLYADCRGDWERGRGGEEEEERKSRRGREVVGSCVLGSKISDRVTKTRECECVRVCVCWCVCVCVCVKTDSRLIRPFRGQGSGGHRLISLPTILGSLSIRNSIFLVSFAPHRRRNHSFSRS